MKIKEYVSLLVDNLFGDLVHFYKLKSGDVTPLQSKQIEEFKLILEDYVKQNGGEE